MQSLSVAACLFLPAGVLVTLWIFLASYGPFVRVCEEAAGAIRVALRFQESMQCATSTAPSR